MRGSNAGRCTDHDTGTASYQDAVANREAPEVPHSPSSLPPDSSRRFLFETHVICDTTLRCTAVRAIDASTEAVTWREALQLWIDCDEGFGEEFRGTLQYCEFDAFFWECRPVSAQTLDDPFEFVLLDANSGFRAASSTDFREHLNHARGQLATVFPNLGGDADLVVPTHHPDTKKASYGHLAKFTREAPEEQQVELWRMAACAVLNTLNTDSGSVLWVNTDGRGVPWVHVRLDAHPKYIKHHPYLRRPGQADPQRVRQARKHGRGGGGEAAKRGKRGKRGRG